jgi:DsbC/DsbD-like thiol-disulfide interchange protein
MRMAAFLSFVLFSGLLTQSAFGAAKVHVRAEMVLLAGKGLAPGKPTPVGIRLKIDPGWHIYWKNPGDSGMPTRVQWQAPQGFDLAIAEFPIPTQFTQPGDIVGYGYEGEVVLLATVTAPKDAAPGTTAKLSAEVSWLSCKDVCVPGKATVSLDVPIVQTGESSDNTDHKETDRYPQPQQDDWVKSVTRTARLIEAKPDGIPTWEIITTVDWKKPPAKVEWFPAIAGNVPIRDITVQTKGDRSAIRAVVYAEKGPLAFDGIIAFTSTDGVRDGLQDKGTLALNPPGNQ